ncbi:MAG: amidohydrolase [Lachnospiraceae bacterium]|nr:amidohydrolase [Lachnospiraceae bacterium]
MGIVIKNVHILGQEREKRTDVYITGDHIASIGKEPASFLKDEEIDGSHKFLMPGLINAHTHGYMTLMRNYADDLPFHEWLFGRILPMEDELTPEDAYWGTLLGMAEMIRSGTTTFVDMHMFPRMVVKACASSGMRALLTRGLVGSDRHDEGGMKRIEQAMDEMEYGKSIGAPCMFGLGPHAIYTCGEDFLRYVTELAHEKGLLINMHLAETKKEFDDCLAEHGMTPAEYAASLGMTDGPAIFAHCVYLGENDFGILANPNVSVATNPASNMKLANGFAPVPRMLKEGIRVALGTDGAGSNNNLNLFTEMHLLTLAHKGNLCDSLVLNAEETVRIATKNGAAAIGREDLGSIEPGKTADLVLIDENAPSMIPNFNRMAAVAYSANGSEVSDVLIGGRIVMRDRQLMTIDEERVHYEVERVASRFRG